jgi:chaperonin cofactor prefoldin
MENYINYLKEQIAKLEDQLAELKAELEEKQGYKNLEDLDVLY